MSIEANKELVKRFYEAIERLEFDALSNMVHEDFVFYPQVDTPFPGVAGLVESEKKSFEAFESFQFPVVTLIAEGDKVAAYMYFEGKNHCAESLGIPPTGRDIRISLLHMLTIKDGKIVEKRAHFDMGDVKRQLTA
ncbi:MAG: ester cyclase [Rhodocyclaceae bacterium]|jgi:predicted ester cyclase|nr:ester cyclase [Rhodocyclaceae bacterium]